MIEHRWHTSLRKPEGELVVVAPSLDREDFGVADPHGASMSWRLFVQEGQHALVAVVDDLPTAIDGAAKTGTGRHDDRENCHKWHQLAPSESVAAEIALERHCRHARRERQAHRRRRKQGCAGQPARNRTKVVRPTMQHRPTRRSRTTIAPPRQDVDQTPTAGSWLAERAAPSQRQRRHGGPVASRNSSLSPNSSLRSEPVPATVVMSALPQTNPSEAGMSSTNPNAVADTATRTSRNSPPTRRVANPPSSQPTASSAMLAPISGSTNAAAATIGTERADAEHAHCDQQAEQAHLAKQRNTSESQHRVARRSARDSPPCLESFEPGDLKRPHLGVADLADLRELFAATPDRRQATHVPQPRRDDVDDQRDAALEQGNHGIDERGAERLRHHSQVQQLGADHTGVRAKRFFDQTANAVGGERNIVVTDEQVRAEVGVIKNRVCVLGESLVCQQTPPTLRSVEPSGDFDLDSLLQEFAEIGVGTAILGLRRLNITRRKLVEDVPALAPIVDGVLDQIEALASPASALLGAAVSGLGDAIAGERGEQLNEAGRVVATAGPELLRLSGLTHRG
ncbi:hypothetical protein GQR58_029160 [Nymphon striatum]|nr:hypothetical protein GQR58_029160 [Nymphon striatum]